VINALTLQHYGGLYVILSSVCTGVVLVFPLSFALAILRYRLWAIDIIINRTVVYGVLTATVIGLYVLIVGGLGALMQGRGNLPLSLAATGTVAILFQPWRERLQRGVNRLLYGDRDEPYAVVSRLGRQLESTLAPNAVLPTIVETVAQALKLPYAAIALRQNEGFRIATAVGAPAGTLLRLPLIYQGDTVGELVLGPRLGDDTFSASDRRLLDDLAREAGAAASAVRLTADLQRSRERLVTAREEERRRLRRDLHDGLGPALASVTLMADAARNLLALDPDASADLLLKLKVETRAATAEIRRVVYALRPPALDELGLVSALREQAAQYGHGGVHMVVEAPEPFPPLPAAVEVATYRIAQEAMTNVLRHARARTCVVRLAIDEGVRLEIADDGRGLDGARTGMGLTSMRERAEELGGWCVVKSLPEGGTCVQAQVPLAGGA
jgi:signal transduction histidine kinase